MQFYKLMSGGASGFNRAVSRWSLDTTMPYWTWVAPPSPTSCSLLPVTWSFPLSTAARVPISILDLDSSIRGSPFPV